MYIYYLETTVNPSQSQKRDLNKEKQGKRSLKRKGTTSQLLTTQRKSFKGDACEAKD